MGGTYYGARNILRPLPPSSGDVEATFIFFTTGFYTSWSSDRSGQREIVEKDQMRVVGIYFSEVKSLVTTSVRVADSFTFKVKSRMSDES